MMEFLEKVLKIMNTEMQTPESYGRFHFICIGILLAATVLTCLIFRRSSDGTVNGLLGTIWVVIVILEIYKQIVYNLEIENGVALWDYTWYAFPFQFCSSPLYILPVIAFSKNEKLRDACIAYMISFSFFAGLAVFCYPNDVFIGTAGINVQTMIHHGSQVLIGAFLACRYKEKMNKKFFLGGVCVFAVMSCIAMLLNEAAFRAFPIFGIDETFNMFYISPNFECTLPVIGSFWGKLPYPAFLALYLLGFVFCAILVFNLLKLVSRTRKQEAR